MPFITIKGTFRLVNQTKTGNPTGFEPDGDSIQFCPDRPTLLDRLQKLVQPYRLTAVGSTQLRFEGIDALELHFTAGRGGVTHQPRPLADQARDHLVTKTGLDPVSYRPPANIRVKPPVPNDGARGYILSRALEVHGRPVSFVFAGDPPVKDGAEIKLAPTVLRQSLNYELLRAGQAYPLFYDTLFADLRDTLAQVVLQAQRAGRGIWAEDKTLSGVSTGSLAQLQANGVIFPKLFRRLAEFFSSGQTRLSSFRDWVAEKQERVLDLDNTNSTHLDTYIETYRNTVKMTKSPDRLVFTSATKKPP